MTNDRKCTYRSGSLSCTNESLPDSDRCADHPKEGGGDRPKAPPPSPTPSPSLGTRIQTGLAIERIIELGVQGWEWIEKHVLPHIPDLFSLATEEQRKLIGQLGQASSEAERKESAERLVNSLNTQQMLVLVVLLLGASAAISSTKTPAGASPAGDA